MARPKLPNPSRARIVHDFRDPTRDKFIALRLAEQLFQRGELAPINLGEAYPNSYAPKGGEYRGAS